MQEDNTTTDVDTARLASEPSPKRAGRFYWIVGAAALLLASLPYLWGYAITPPGQIYTGFTPANIDDTGVYFAWMRQAEEGHFFLRNRFTTEPQKGVLFNLFFWLLGTLTRLTGLPMIAVYQGARVICGALLLWAIALLLRETLRREETRRMAFALTCFAAGFGFLWAQSNAPAMHRPVDLWQPEAITFPSLYTSPLFCAALALMAAFMTSVARAERTGRLRDIGPAALAGALLGNFHSYDILHLFAVWGVYRILTDALRRRLDMAGWVRLILAGIATLPTAAYQYWALRVETVFYARAFQTFTWSPPLVWTLLGLGIPLLLVVGLLIGLGCSRRVREEIGGEFAGADALRLLLVWSVVGVAVAYVPFPFQRKLLMGVHLPLCAVGGAVLGGMLRRSRKDVRHTVVFAVLAFAVPTNIWLLWRDMDHLTINVSQTAYRPRLTTDEWAALQWLRDNTSRDAAVLVAPDPTVPQRYPFLQALLPHLAVYVPAFAGNVVYNGHWSETARFGEKLAESILFFQESTPDLARRSILGQGDIRYVLYLHSLAGVEWPDARGVPQRAVDWRRSAPSYLRPVYSNETITIFEYRPGL